MPTSEVTPEPDVLCDCMDHYEIPPEDGHITDHMVSDHAHDCVPTPPCGGCQQCVLDQYVYYYKPTYIGKGTDLPDERATT